MQGNLRTPDFSNKIERGNKFWAWPINEEKCHWLCQQQKNLSPSQEIKPQTYRFIAPMPNLWVTDWGIYDKWGLPLAHLWHLLWWVLLGVKNLIKKKEATRVHTAQKCMY